ncbi:Nephrocystin-3, partial [Durusdinium trenchii]
HVLLQDYPEDSQIRVKDFLDILFSSKVHKAESRVREEWDVKKPSTIEAQNEEPSSSSNGKEVKARRQVQAVEAEKEELKKQLENVKREASLKDYFEKGYKEGLVFDHKDYRHDAKDWCWVHTKLGVNVKVWQDALDLTASDASDVQCLFHYTNEFGFRNITDLRKTAVELFASLRTAGKDANAWWGKGVYSVRKPPDEWENIDAIIENNYLNMKKRDIEKAEKQGPEAVKDVEESYRSKVAFCIPILVNSSIAYDVSKRQTPEMVEQ